MRFFIKSVAVLGIIYIFFVNGCEKNKYDLEIIVENSTEKDITLVSFSDKIIDSAPLLVKSNSQVRLFSDTGGDIDLFFLYNEKKYYTNTGYADDYKKYTLIFSENEQGILECLFTVRAFGKDVKRLLDLEIIQD